MSTITSVAQRRNEPLRVERQSEWLAADADDLLDAIGPLAGRRVVELGCGLRGCLDALSERVGPHGSVVGVGRNPVAVLRARGHAADRGLENVELVHADLRATGLPGDAFDLVLARLALVGVPRPEDVVAEAVRLVRPGAPVAFYEVQAFFAGRRLSRLLRDAGLVDVHARSLSLLGERDAVGEPQPLVQAWGRKAGRPSAAGR
jgi:ubiquinone/menaquinone biosynthesis C-methylase UbiE